MEKLVDQVEEIISRKIYNPGTYDDQSPKMPKISIEKQILSQYNVRKHKNA